MRGLKEGCVDRSSECDRWQVGFEAQVRTIVDDDGEATCNGDGNVMREMNELRNSEDQDD